MWKALIKLIEKWAYRCEHNWIEIDSADVYEHDGSKRPYKTVYAYKCTKCCDHKVITVK